MAGGSKGKPGPSSVSSAREDARRRLERATALIKKHGGQNAREAARNEWVVQVVSNIDNHYWKKLMAEKSLDGDITEEDKEMRKSTSKNAQVGALNAAVAELKVLQAELERERAAKEEEREARKRVEDREMSLRLRLEEADRRAEVAESEILSARQRMSGERRRDLKLRGASGSRVFELKESLKKAKLELRARRKIIRSQNIVLDDTNKDKANAMQHQLLLVRQMESLSHSYERDKREYDTQVRALRLQLASLGVATKGYAQPLKSKQVVKVRPASARAA